MTLTTTRAGTVDIIIPTIGRPSLMSLLAALGQQASGQQSMLRRIILVDDRAHRSQPLLAPDFELGSLAPITATIQASAAGPAAARNLGWRASSSPWIAFLDDDVIPDPDWLEHLSLDLREVGPEIGGSQGRLRVPLPANRRPTDWERNVAGLQDARWITADMAYRRTVLEQMGGFDERFKRAYREDADFALRVTNAGYRIVLASRRASHPVPAADRWVSVRAQAGNADDVLMRRLHGRRWQFRVGAAPGRRARHIAITTSLAAGLTALAVRRPRLAAAGLLAAAAGTAEFATARILPGPRTPAEIGNMLLTSALIPPLATWHWLRGWARWRTVSPAGAPAMTARPTTNQNTNRPAAVLFDRDGTLVEDVPFNGDPSRVTVMPTARRAIDRLRAAGIPTGVVSNQSGVGRGRITMDQVRAVNARIEELLGPLGPWAVCPHAPEDQCECRKPAPGLVNEAAARLGVQPDQCVVVGDIGSDIDAATAAGARAILVPTSRTRPEEIGRAPEVAPDLLSAVERLLPVA